MAQDARGGTDMRIDSATHGDALGRADMETDMELALRSVRSCGPRGNIFMCSMGFNSVPWPKMASAGTLGSRDGPVVIFGPEVETQS